MWIQFQPFTQLAKAGVWDPTPFLDQIRHQQFALILLTSEATSDDPIYLNKVSAEMLSVIRSSYVLDKQMWLYYVYVPSN
jgi:hypothetical protein